MSAVVIYQLGDTLSVEHNLQSSFSFVKICWEL